MRQIVSTSNGSLDSRARIVAFPFAGGSDASYADMARALGGAFAFTTLSLPGRGATQHIPFYDDWPSLVDDLAAEVARLDDGTPFFLFGHSLGALLAYEVARALEQRGGAQPAGVFLSGHPAPSRERATDAWRQPTHALPDTAFIEAVRRWGFFPDGALDDADVARYVLPPLRADLRLAETYRHAPGDALRAPCAIYGGAADPSTTIDDLRAWRAHVGSQHACPVETFDGHHFYFLEPTSRAALCASVAGHIERRLAERPASIVAATPDPGSRVAACLRAADDWGDAHSVLAAIREHVARTPDALALKDGERTWTYRQLASHAGELADAFRAAGVGRQDVVGVFLPHGAEYVLTIVAAWSIGASVCLLEKSWPDSLVGEFVASCRVAQFATTPELLARAAKHLPDARCTLVGARPPLADRAWASVAPRPDDIAFVSLTSGSTGKPKAVLTTHIGTSYCFHARDALYPYADGEREGLNVFLAWECLRPLMFGRPAVVIGDDVIFDPPRLVALLRRERITRLVVTPSLLESVLDFPGVAAQLRDALAHMSAWFLMGEVVPPRVVDKARAAFPPSVRLVNAYSTWESLDVCYADLLPSRASDGSRRVPIGRPLPGCALAVLDDAGRAVPAGETGELHIASPGLGPGYLDDAARTAEKFLPSAPALAERGHDAPVYRTGDRARLLPDGQISILGRIDNTVKIRGFKVLLHAVENVLDAVEGVSKSLVVPIDDPHTRQPSALAAYVVGSDGAPSETTLARLRQQARAKLPEYAVPAHFIGLDAFALRAGTSRKLDKQALPPVPSDARTAPRDAAAPSAGDGLEARLAQVWRDVLGVASVARDDHFFELGGNSLSAAKAVGLLGERLGLSLAVVDLYQHSRLRDLADHCRRSREDAARPRADEARDVRAPRAASAADAPKVAIVGMAGRFPGADSVDAFWRNLTQGVDSLSRFAREQLLAKGVDAATLDHPDWVPAAQAVSDADKFDALFFGIGPREAALMDPQHRLFMQVAWSALEQAGYARADNRYRTRTGVFASCGIDGYLVHHLQGGGLLTPLDPGRLMLTEIGNEKDYIATRVAYQLDLGGPAVSVGAACSSALVAVVQAVQAIRAGQCEMAIAGASALSFPNFGFCYEDGLVGSADGHVRPFDARASGTLFGDAVGAVALKRLDLAEADGDPILAVISGVGLSNDGRMKAGYTAPNADAQRRCIVDALDMAGVRSEQISYVECHATATLIGDAIELKGLSDAFAQTRGAGADIAAVAGGCAIGSVKGNIGHANCAAGITGLIKTVLQLQHRQRVPTVHFDTLNPKLVPFVEHDASPFVVQRRIDDWSVADPATQLPRRAGVSSFGIGGTNAHVIVEEAPARAAAPAEGVPRAHHLMTVSARTPGALARNLRALAEQVATMDAADLGCAAHTLHVARDAHPLRVALAVPARPAEAAAALRERAGALDEAPDAGDAPGAPVRAKPGATVAFCFSGQGSQHPGMARELYRSNAEAGRFRHHFDAACAALERALGAPIADTILNAGDDAMRRPLVTQCGLFALEHALASVLGEYGVRPVAVAGHSIGQYAAAVAAEALTLEQAAALVAARARATEALTALAAGDGAHVRGGMLAVTGDDARIEQWAAGRADMWIAVRNAPRTLVLAGTEPALADAARALAALGCRCRPVPVSHPFHTPLMQPVADAIAAQRIEGAAPRIPMTCNVTGGWLGADAASADYWARHLREPVRWSDNVAALLRWQPDIVLEIGPGAVLCGLIGRHIAAGASADASAHANAPRVLPSLPAARDGASDADHFSNVIGQLWCAGVAIDWRAYHAHEAASPGRALARVPLPGYAFERDSYWTRPEASIYVDAAPAAAESEISANRAENHAANRASVPADAAGITPNDAPATPRAHAASTLACSGGCSCAAGSRSCNGGHDATAAARIAAPPPPASRWLARLRPRRRPRMKLYCFPYAGGSSRSFDGWARTAPDWLDIVAIEWPGRNARAEESPARDDADDLAARDAIAAAIVADAGELPVAFCGLSYGGAAATELLAGPLRAWAASGRVKGLAVVGRAPLLEQPAIDAPADSFLLVPDALRDDPLWQEIFRPVLEADLDADTRTAHRIARRWRDGERRPLLATPLQIHGGDDDPAFDWRLAGDWARISSAPLAGLHAYPGGHDFMMRCEAEIVARVAAWLRPQRAARTVAPAPMFALHWQPRAIAPDSAIAAVASRLDAPGAAAGEAPSPECAVYATGGEAGALEWLAPRLRASDGHAALLCIGAADDPLGVAQCAGFVRLWQALAARECTGTLTLVLPAGAASGPLVGAARVASAEHAALRVRLVLADDHPDLAPREADPRWAAGLARDAARCGGEPWLLHRAGRMFAPRLMPHAAPALPEGALGAAGGPYLVTGAAGGVGRALIDWLIDEQQVPPEKIVALCRDAASAPRGVRAVAVDLADERALDAALESIDEVEGIFHLAGTLDDGVIANLDDARLRRVLAPKQSLAALLAHAPRWRTRWAVAFSSTSALLGVPGQANYAAANAWLDQLACWPARPGEPPVLSIQWGSWADVGMSARNGRALRRAMQDGERPLAPDAAFAALGALLAGVLGGATAGRQFAVCDVDWPRSPWRDAPIAADIARGDAAGAATAHDTAAAHDAPNAPNAANTARAATAANGAGRANGTTAMSHTSASGNEAVIRADDGSDSARSIQPEPARPAAAGPEAPAAQAARPASMRDPVRAFLEDYVSRWDERLDLATLGLDSLDLAQMRNGFFKKFGVQIPLSTLASPTLKIGELARRMRNVAGIADE
ncbi:type I polyketide synthase [Burkholderia thailandensis]|uniref:type I polyketide synthase n=2 Tax=Burkholderia thailandensis TaxID=57975 RepID=UPI0005B7448E|nr:type I polyketide synthase [Burkholderia thailandensis]AVR07622.1 KR domain-containing protein [Burkholderia thailandensis]AWY65093.1 polyketide synthase [Burkholderia thailandensis]KIS54405.1 AMP-binding enzyme family protein [Burkholderia thailandensis Phuket 4W-1]MCS6507573.1 alpha/beta fold hydrolase [Burkholderia thailandensis]NBJ20314.1 alpha/beta fold hydrolase [Burkholderia thailandensis]